MKSSLKRMKKNQEKVLIEMLELKDHIFQEDKNKELLLLELSLETHKSYY